MGVKEMTIRPHFSGFRERNGGSLIVQHRASVRAAAGFFRRTHGHAQGLPSGTKKEATSAEVFGNGALFVVGGMLMGRMVMENVRLARELNVVAGQPASIAMAENSRQQDWTLAGIVASVLLVAYAGYRLLRALAPELGNHEK